ncbi:MAG TPA: hypothetical protein VFP50_18160 [Anaeromyxobacteraceae bacterium]|nr:hypothetical protein [Anaeromyxobacteraceae bacterium]
MTGAFTCGRRRADGLADPDSPFVGAGAGLDTWRADGTCSYCGSLNEATLMARLEAGDVELTPTDKSYKVYVRNAGGDPFQQTYRDCPAGSPPHMPDACEHWVTRETSETKFYFQHLDEQQRRRFVELLNEKKMKLGYPGHFYRLPFFISRGGAT